MLIRDLGSDTPAAISREGFACGPGLLIAIRMAGSLCLEEAVRKEPSHFGRQPVIGLLGVD